MLTVYKCTRENGFDFYTGNTINYRELLNSGKSQRHPDPEPANDSVDHRGTCGRGYHVAITPLISTEYGYPFFRPFSWFEIQCEESDVIERDERKWRLSGFCKVTRELSVGDVFGVGALARLQKAQTEIASWASIRWLKPVSVVTDEVIDKIYTYWYNKMIPYMNKALPQKVKVVRSIDLAEEAAKMGLVKMADGKRPCDAAAGIDTSAYVNTTWSGYKSLVPYNLAFDWGNMLRKALDNLQSRSIRASVDLSQSPLKVIDRDYFVCFSSYPQPYFMAIDFSLTCCAESILGGSEQASLVELYKLGCWPIGYVDNEMVIYAPEPVK